MTLRDVAAEIAAKVLYGSDELLDTEIATAASSDLMSDVLARLGTPDVLLTGLTTTQAIRTSSVAEIKAVVIVRGKPVDERLVELASEEDILLMATDLSLFEASGRLYEKGLRSGVRAT